MQASGGSMPAPDGAAMFPNVRGANGMPDMHLMPGMMTFSCDIHKQDCVSILLQFFRQASHVQMQNTSPKAGFKLKRGHVWQAQMGGKRRRTLT